MFRKLSWKQAVVFFLLFATATGWFYSNSFADNEKLYFKLDKGLFYLRQVYETIVRNYVDEVDPEGLSKSAIRGIVGELDPYTVFFEDKGNERLRMITKGKYGGLGMEIGKRNGQITVISPIDNTPAKRAGIQAGDVIIEIDGKSTENMTLEEASRKLRGKVGTQVTIKIKRPGVEKPFTLTLTRAEINLKDVSFADFIEPGTVLIRLNSFSDKAGRELRQAIRDLQKKGTIERVIFDLRGNPGGLLASAVDVANVFLPKGELVVSTRGVHEKEAKYFTQDDPLLPNVPLVVLVNNGSASASEIVAGAIQDLDRGVIMGTPTFGKGLVQKVFPVDQLNDAYLKITTAKYYIPSGRCIQKEDYKKNKEVFLDLKDSTDFNQNIDYRTRNGRIVHGGGGIKPDIEIKTPKADHFLMALWSSGYFFQFAVDYLAEHPELRQQETFTLTDEIIDAFKKYLAEKNLQFDIEGETELKDFLKIADEQHYDPEITDLVKVAISKLDNEKEKEFSKNLPRIKEYLEAEFAEKLFGSTGRMRAIFNHDKLVKKALALLNDPEKYNQVLAVK